jgi:redox-sensing transcriptional repressor
MREQISELTTSRLSLYLRFLNELDGKGVKTVSSKMLAEQFGLSAALIRKDLSNFGDLGVRGVGYVVEDLRRELRSILGLDRGLRVAIVGAGNLGLALADYPGFRQEGLRIVALFDNLQEKVVQTVVQAGIKAILNFSPGALRVPPHVKLKSVDLTVSLESLSFYLANEAGPGQPS